MQMGMSMKVNGRMIKHMVMASIIIMMELTMRVTGKKTSNTATAKKSGLMVHAMKETI